jgi:hypothetical protein
MTMKRAIPAYALLSFTMIALSALPAEAQSVLNQGASASTIGSAARQILVSFFTEAKTTILVMAGISLACMFAGMIFAKFNLGWLTKWAGGVFGISVIAIIVSILAGVNPFS